MTSRISTGQMFNQSLSTMLARQKDLQHLQQQLATGRKLVTAADNPVAAGNAVTLDHALAKLEQYDLNGNAVQNRLQLQESVLAQVNDQLSRAKELTLQANTDTLSATDRQAIATELKAINAQLISLANSQDGAGRYLFGGTNDAVTPFARTAGVVTYQGDQTQNHIEIAPDMYVADAQPGSELFLRVRTGTAGVDASPVAGNTGTGIVSGLGRDNTDAWNGQSQTVTFTSANTYEVHNAEGTLVSTGDYTPGEHINAAGLNLQISGAPATGDSFIIGASSTRDIFSTLDGLITTLETPATTPAARAMQRNTMNAALRDISTASDHLIDARAKGGTQLANLDDASSLREANSISLQTTLSALRDLDYAEAITQYQLQSTALQAAQQVFTSMQRMTLFDVL